LSALLAGIALVVGVLALPGVARAAPASCFGRTATITGTNGDETLSGTPGDDVIAGLGGDDTIHGNGGADLICGGGGSDSLSVDAGTGHLGGGPGDDLLFGGAGHDRLTGNGGNDQLFGGAGKDNLTGGAGDDSIDGEAGSDALVGSTGFDTVFYLGAPGGVQVSLAAGTGLGDGSDTLSGFESVLGSQYNDVLTGDAGPTDVLAGGPGNDTLKGGDGPASNCTISGSCFDYLAGGEGNDILDGGPGTDFASFFDSLFPVDANLATGVATGDGTDTISGIEGIDGSSGADSLTGNGADHVFVGESGADTISGHGHVNGDAVFYLFATGPVNVSLTSGTSTGADGSDALTNIQYIAGSEFDDSLVGNGQGNIILGLDGSDSLDGAGGFDALDGGPGTDSCLNGEQDVNCESTSHPVIRHDAGAVAGAAARDGVILRGLLKLKTPRRALWHSSEGDGN
jgi:Ca2+-binding RTX toxin-like protein